MAATEDAELWLGERRTWHFSFSTSDENAGSPIKGIVALS
jgi:hypothetical protein